jgi:hypothetical protein
MTARDAVMQAFDSLFDRAAEKLAVECSAEEKEEAKREFAERFRGALEIVEKVAMPGISEEVVEVMETAIDRLSPAQLVGYLASIPLMQQTQILLQQLAYRAAEQRLLEHLASQADAHYGGN